MSLALYALAFGIYVRTPAAVFKEPGSPVLWALVVLVLFGAIAGNVRAIALSTLVTVLVPLDRRDRANGLVGTTNGVAFLGAGVLSGLVVGNLGIYWVLVSAIGLTGLAIAHLWTLPIPDDRNSPERHAARSEANADRLDIRGTIAAIKLVPGLFGLIFFQTFNNFLGGVFMSLRCV